MSHQTTIARAIAAAVTQQAKRAHRIAALAMLALAGAVVPGMAQAQAQAGIPLTGASVVTVGQTHSCALVGGGIKCWGGGIDGQLGNGTSGRLPDGSPNQSSFAVDVAGIGNAVDVAAGDHHACAVGDDGAVRCWGRNDYGQLGDGTQQSSAVPVDVVGIGGASGLTARKVEAGAGHTCAIVDTATVTGAVYCWGSNEFGQLGNGTSSLTPEWTPVPAVGVTGATEIAAGYGYTCAVVTGGDVKCWGNDEVGQLGDGGGASSATPIDVFLGVPATRIAAGESHACALLVDGSVACWGSNGYGQLGRFPFADNMTPALVTGIAGATALGAGWADTCAVIANDTVDCWGNSSPITGVPAQVSGVAGASRVEVGTRHTCAVAGSGVQCWGENGAGQLGNGFTSQAASPVGVVGVTGAGDVAAGGYHTCFVESGGVRCAGGNQYGQLGDGTTTPSGAPVSVANVVLATQVAAGGYHSCARSSDGKAWCWGWNLYGQVGNATYADHVAPVALPIGAVAQVAAGRSHSCALLADQTVMCWGENSYGQLGLGDNVNRNTPVAVPGLGGVVEIAAGGGHTCARLGDGTARCWGANDYGQLGNGNNAHASTPQGVAGLAGATQIAAAGGHTCARLGDGTARCWGYNFFSQLGDGTTVNANLPKVVNLAGILQIAAGGSHTCARVADGTVKCWGSDTDGELGDGGWPTGSAAPVAVVGLAGVTRISAFGSHTCALTGAGAAQCWGRAAEGQLGNGQTGLYGTPAVVLAAATAGPTTTAIASSPNPSVYGQPVTLTATVSGGAAPTGTVGFAADGAGIAGCGAVTLVSGQAQCLVSDLAPGARSLNAAYSGDATNPGSMGAALHTVAKAAITLAITAPAPNSSAVALSPVTVTVSLAAVAPGAGSPAGTVAVSWGSDTCTITLSYASCVLTPTSLGTGALSASYAGDANFAAAPTDFVMLTVTPIPQSIAIAPIPAHALSDLRVEVSASGGASGNPVVFGTATPAVCTVAGPIVTLVAVGTCTLTADQAGGGVYAPAPQATVSFAVTIATATLALSSSPNPSAEGQAVVVTLAVSGAGTLPTPTGTATFREGASVFCASVALSAGTAQCTIPALAGGPHAIDVDYSGDAVYAAASLRLAHSVATTAYAIADVDYPGATDTEVRALTDNGQLVAVATLGGVPTFAVYAGGSWTLPPNPAAGVTASPWGIEAGGTIVGAALGTTGTAQGFTLAGSTYTLFSRPGWARTEARGINAGGTIVGWSSDSAATTLVPFIRDPATGSYTDIVISGVRGSQRIAHGINASGQVVGSVEGPADAEAFLRETDGTVTTFRVNGLPTLARGINDAGAIAGHVLANGLAQGFVGNAATGYAILVVPGAVQTFPLAINNAGQVAGYWVDASGRRHGFIATLANMPVGVTTAGGFQFDVAVVGGQPVFIDPPVAVGYDYAIGTGNPLFQAVRLPVGFGDSLYTVTAGGVGTAVAGGQLHDLRSAGNPHGVAAFRVTGIEPSAYVDPADARGFPTEITFAASGRFTGTQTPIVADVPWPTAMIATASPNPARAGDSITFVATVTSPGGVPTGTVTFGDQKRTLCSAPLAGGQAQCTVHPLSVGDHAITASYEGDADHAAATQAIKLRVNSRGGR